MTPWMRTLHKWVGLIVAIQFVLWVVSGLTMSLLDHERVEGSHHRASQPHAHSWPTDAIAPNQAMSAVGQGVLALETAWLLDTPVYRLTTKDGIRLLEATSAVPVTVDAAKALAVANADYAGQGKPQAPVRLDRPTLEVRDHAGPIWQVPFDDADGTTLYVSAEDGRILERRNDAWRLFDIAWMLHIMDYTGRKNFNHPLIIMMGAGGLWIALSGFWLLVASFRLSEFVPARMRPASQLTVLDNSNTVLRSVPSHAGDTVYVAMARNGLQLPSNCGGGQSCGLCEVRVAGTAPKPTAADRKHIEPGRLKAGYRLACNLPTRKAPKVQVAAGASLWTERQARVDQVRAVTPFLREIVLAPDTTLGQEFRPGSYLQIHVPDYTLQRDALTHPEDHRDDWATLNLPDTISNKEPVRRAYSLALPLDQAAGRLTLLARFSPGRQEKKRSPVGKGSTYLYALKPGDPVRFSGPFGDFALKSGTREKVFIGGGAGMAPLRAMVRDRLQAGADERIHYWYGARNLREAPYVDEMADLAAKHANFSWHLVLSDDAEQGDAFPRGFVHEVTHEYLLHGHPDLSNCEFYVCGPPAMLAATRQLLKRLAVSDEMVAFDDFKI